MKPGATNRSESNPSFRLLLPPQTTSRRDHFRATGDVSGAFSFVDSNDSKFRYRFYRTTN
jgi:hypothetical protein